ncbi:putative transcription-silencing protein [Rosellinia necatrix]|uniref:Putative transcription-silencing protein n=1 Tax=Rosellinia necatrix TaxID=77044 RepID=A0A1W2TB69_ROSNE|nr:putative transcription-silencing protein [Rosellinia necatrix]
MASRKAKDLKAADNENASANAIALQVWRSDGTEMPSEYSQYEKVEEGAKPIIEWQNKLGQALAAELMPSANGMYFLQEFPAHYHLRWYQAKEERKKSQAKHYYLFGYPEDPGANKARKYYRSPNHFLPHLIWLIGESQDRGDCACEFCSGSKPITSKAAKTKPILSSGPALSPAATSAPPPVSTPSINTTNTAASTHKTTAASSSSKPRATSRPSASSQQPSSHEVQTAVPYQTPAVAPSVAQHPYPVVHDHDALFRAGEVVWYKNNNSWRVGMILISGPTLSIIPFGHPQYRTLTVVKEEADVRPFLAFSIPQINSGLQELKGRALDQIDWQALQERFGTHTDASRREGLAIEATKLAATRVDHSYSTFNQLPESVPNYTMYGGLFLGAEKICVGEAVRIKLPREQQDPSLEKGMPMVMVIWRISISKDGGVVVSEGSLWKLQHTPLTHPPTNQVQLPAAMLGEKEFRDGILQSRGWRVEWVLVNRNMSVDESAIRGRFYETRRLTPILNPAKFENMVRQQHIEDIQSLLNNRGDSSGPHVGRVLNRAQAVAGAIPLDVSIPPSADLVEAY